MTRKSRVTLNGVKDLEPCDYGKVKILRPDTNGAGFVQNDKE